MHEDQIKLHFTCFLLRFCHHLIFISENKDLLLLYEFYTVKKKIMGKGL